MKGKYGFTVHRKEVIDFVNNSKGFCGKDISKIAKVGYQSAFEFTVQLFKRGYVTKVSAGGRNIFFPVKEKPLTEMFWKRESRKPPVPPPPPPLLPKYVELNPVFIEPLRELTKEMREVTKKLEQILAWQKKTDLILREYAQ